MHDTKILATPDTWKLFDAMKTCKTRVELSRDYVDAVLNKAGELNEEEDGDEGEDKGKEGDER